MPTDMKRHPRSSLPWLAHAAPLRDPGPALRARLVAALAPLTPDRVEVRADRGAFAPGASPGLSAKVLLCDAHPRRRTLLGRLEAGASYPSHRHAGDEELYLLAGDLTVQGRRMGPGDFCAAVAGTAHHAVRSAAGALFVMVASDDDHPCTETAGQELGLSFAMADEAAWQPAPGGDKRLLFQDDAAGTETAVLQLAAGSGLLQARAGTQLFVLDGEVVVDGARYGAGDFRYSAATARLQAARGTVLLIDSPPLVTQTGA